MDLVRAPGAVTDTDWGNRFLTIGKSLAAAAFWLDDQTKTGQAAEDAGVAPAMEQFDQVVSSISNGMLGIYGLWLGIGLTAAASIMLWHALKSNAAGVTKSMAVGGAALALGALLIGAPQQAIRLADDTFGAVITDTQNEMLSVSGSGKGPRDVLLDDIFLDDWRKLVRSELPRQREPARPQAARCARILLRGTAADRERTRFGCRERPEGEEGGHLSRRHRQATQR